MATEFMAVRFGRHSRRPPNRRFKLCGRGLRAEADAARRLRAGACPATARVAEGDAQLELRAACRPLTL